MTPATGIVRDGKIEIAAPIDLKEGAEVRIWLEASLIEDDDGPMSDEEVSRTLAAMDKVEPLIMTVEERSNWEKSLADQKTFEISNFETHLKKLQSYWK